MPKERVGLLQYYAGELVWHLVMGGIGVIFFMGLLWMHQHGETGFTADLISLNERRGPERSDR